MNGETLAVKGGTPVRSDPFPDRFLYGAEDVKQVTEALMSQDLFYRKGNKTALFEEAFAKRYGVKYAVTATSGTASVHMAVAALDLNPGDEVITAPVTDFGTIAGLLFQGLIPVFADWAPNTFSMDPVDIEKKITERTKAIIVVHLFGNPCDMNAILAVAKKHDLRVIEDCCQAYFTEYQGKLAGTIGDIGCFSMQQSKHLATGEGGVVISNRDDFGMRMTLFRDKGWENRGQWGARYYSFLGLNYRMNDLTGAVALSQFGTVENRVRKMNELGAYLTERIKDIPGILPAPVTPGGTHSYWLYPIKITGYDPVQFIRELNGENIPFGWGYTVDPIYLCTDALAKHNTFGNSAYPFHLSEKPIVYEKGLCPVAETELHQIGVLRFHELWTKEDMDDVARAIGKVARAHKKPA